MKLRGTFKYQESSEPDGGLKLQLDFIFGTQARRCNKVVYIDMNGEAPMKERREKRALFFVEAFRNVVEEHE